MKYHFDITEIVKRYQKNQFPERRELFQEFTAAMRDNPELKLLLAEVAQECYAQKCSPVAGLGTAMTMGMVLGVILERNRKFIV